MSERTLAWLLGLGSILPLYLFATRYLAGGTGSDFWPMHNAGRAIMSGATVYGTESIFPYPPHSLFLFTPLAVPPFQVGLAVFSLLGAGLFLLAARPYVARSFPLAFAVCTPGSLFCLYYGQTGLIVGGLWLLAFRGRWPAVALLTIKPHLGVLGVLSLRSVSNFVKTCGLVVLLIIASMIVFGSQIWLDFFAALKTQAGLIGVRAKWDSIGVSPAISLGFVAWILFALAAAFLLSKRVTPFTAATAALLISPYAFLYDMPVASLGFAMGIRNGWDQLRWFERSALIASLLAPCFVFFVPWAVPPILLWGLWTQVQADRRGPSESASNATPAAPTLEGFGSN